jgi:hypothetical protein
MTQTKRRRGRPLGWTRERPFLNALRMEIARAEDDNDFRSLRRIARKLLKVAAGGDILAIRELADRLDGRTPIRVAGDAEEPIEVVHRIERVIVDAIASAPQPAIAQPAIAQPKIVPAQPEPILIEHAEGLNRNGGGVPPVA